MSARALEPDDVVVIEAGETSMVLGVDDGRVLRQLSFGPTALRARPAIPVGLYPVAHPTHGEEPLREPALRITHADGALTTRLIAVDHEDEAADGTIEHRVRLRDRIAPVEVVLGFRAWPDHGVLERWVEIVNLGAGAITVSEAASAAPALAGTDPWFTHWGGGWAAEWTETSERLTEGLKVAASAGGVRPALTCAPVAQLAPNGLVSEDDGLVVASLVAWGGDVRFAAEVARGQVRLFAGASPRGAERLLEAGARFVTPTTVWAWSGSGAGPLSRRLHRWVRETVLRDGDRLRATVANTWEAVGFDFDADTLVELIDRSAELGAELFLLDDGWFGEHHPRDRDDAGLGDWTVDRRKLPDGLGPLIDRTLERGLRFGLWVEPEMVNPRSALYESHPDWVIADPGRERREDRQQLVLDVVRPETRAFVGDVVHRLLDEHPGITFLKWDANRDIGESGSAALPPDRQSHAAVDRVGATWSVMAEIADRHPDVELMLCASGGGRSDVGTLCWFHEVWTSDNTDPVDRVRLQWGASHALPALAMAAHVTRWGGRPLAFGCAVAMSGRFGFDVDLRSLQPDEWDVCRRAVAHYHRIRDVVQLGELWRLVSPVDSDRGAVSYVASDRSRAVVFAYQLAGRAEVDPRCPVAGIEPDATYRVEVLHLEQDEEPPGTWTGRDLLGAGLPWPTGEGPVAAVTALTRLD